MFTPCLVYIKIIPRGGSLVHIFNLRIRFMRHKINCTPQLGRAGGCALAQSSIASQRPGICHTTYLRGGFQLRVVCSDRLKPLRAVSVTPQLLSRMNIYAALFGPTLRLLWSVRQSIQTEAMRYALASVSILALLCTYWVSRPLREALLCEVCPGACVIHCLGMGGSGTAQYFKHPSS